MLGENLQNSARDTEFSLGGLIGVRRGADDDRFTLEQLEVTVASKSESSTENLRRISLDENVSLEREPWRQLLVRVAERVGHFFVGGGALHHIAMRVARVAIRASEGAADVRID